MGKKTSSKTIIPYENHSLLRESKFCPICGNSSRKFGNFGVIPREDAQCMYCGSLERHRLLWLFLQNKTDLFDNKPKKMLHVAPELCLEPKFKKLLNNNYLTADLYNPRAMVKMDITEIQYNDHSFDAIYCSHVLEHVPNDRQAIREFYRVLKNDGWAILLVPIGSDKTFEDLSITDPKERLKIYGHEDHVRCYGPDYVERLREAGFNVETFKVDDLADKNEMKKIGLTSACGDIFYCTK